MSESARHKGGFSRRAVTIGGGITAALGLAAIGVTVPRLFAKRYAKTPYDDLLAQLTDRETAAKLGHGATGKRDWNRTVETLRARLKAKTLAETTRDDLAKARLAEIQGWVLPETLTLLCVLAAFEDN